MSNLGTFFRGTGSGDTPVGSVSAMSTATVPSGYLECTGAPINRTTYSALFAIIATNYGIGDGATTFNIPDLRGEFLRGWNNASGNDVDAGARTDRGDGTTGDFVGTKQVDEFKSHTHPNDAGVSTSVDFNSGGGTFSDVLLDSGSAVTGAAGGNETRPRNINMMYCIRY